MPLSRSLPHQLRRDLKADLSGSVSVGFALVIGFLIAIIGGTVEVGRVLMAKNEMNHALARASRMVIMDGSQTESEIVTMMQSSLSDYDPDLLDITSSNATVAGVNYVTIDVEFPHETSIPFRSLETVILRAETSVPIVSPTVTDP